MEAFEKYSINENKMLRCADRRGRKKHLVITKTGFQIQATNPLSCQFIEDDQ